MKKAARADRVYRGLSRRSSGAGLSARKPGEGRGQATKPPINQLREFGSFVACPRNPKPGGQTFSPAPQGVKQGRRSACPLITRCAEFRTYRRRWRLGGGQTGDGDAVGEQET